MNVKKNDFSLILATKWLVILAIGVIIVVGNYYYSSYLLIYRTLVILGLLGLAAVIFYTTEQGKATFQLMVQARIEIGRVVWPTRPEMVQTFISVVVMVGLAMLVLWGLDSLFSWLASLIIA